ncbi:MAG: FmdB family zinc ribbon protein [Planctomycetota bacterium]|jgi:hypothetical protein
MPILVRCESCGHEITVSDSMEGKRGRCPKCDGVVKIPRKGGGRSGRTPKARNRYTPPYGALAAFATFLNFLALAGFLCLAFIGVYTGVTALVHGPDGFYGPLGLFREYAEADIAHPTIVGLAFIVGGLAMGSLHFLFVSAAAQVLRLFISVERSLVEVSDHLARREG